MENQIVEFNEFDTQLAEFKSTYDNVVYDLTDPVQEKSARSDRLSIGKVISRLDSTHKALKAPLKAKTDLIDAERKRIKDDLLGVQGKIKSQIADHERKIQEHAEKLQIMVDDITVWSLFYDDVSRSSESIQLRIDKVKSVVVDDSYEHRKADAALAQIDALKILEPMLDDALKQEAEQMELERLREEQRQREQAEREEKIRADAEMKARHEAEQEAEKIKQQAAIAEEARKKRERELQEEIEAEKTRVIAEKAKAKADAEELARAVEIETRKAVERAAQEERERLEAEANEKVRLEAEAKAKEEAKKSKQAHRAKVHKAAKTSLLNHFDDATATQIVTLIKDGEIANVLIQY